MRLVLDTNIYCDFAEGVPQTVDIMAELGESIYLPAVVIGELFYGFMNGRRREWNEMKLNEIIEKLQITVIDVTQPVASKYGLIYLSLVKKGHKIPLNDVWIAACCMEVGGTLLTRDHHFEYVEQIDKLIL
ncbi:MULTISPECIES: type II toxin-antitoxin system VapC family toxin [Desulfococcus]|uniref:PilT protein domain protein n=1 Tax=Desulfococcus multivorans DSM 2059 TaxID=1121405 RepID=S7TCM1_DESML|nr:type II toxin-antitoxin system VapC family toxin [Desulfococcus multivorans]EPR34255.1 PilT protein domain protein [Desulfococcus multivorans DSM 2059]SKA06057.1 tRNA(fMet)-specific endonuclease VapC [Desulfococcus multivorans DSM 2059]